MPFNCKQYYLNSAGKKSNKAKTTATKKFQEYISIIVYSLV